MRYTDPPTTTESHCMTTATLRHDWSLSEIEALLDQPFSDLLFAAQQLHREQFDPNRIQVSSLLSIKSGRCAEDCGYCSQSAKYATSVQGEKLLELEQVITTARAAQQQGASRFCMGAAWRNPTDRQLERVIEMVTAVHELGMESCLTLGMLTQAQAQRLKEAGLDYYNHNLDTSPEFYGEVVTTRTFADRLETLAHIREAGIQVCSGGILGMGESRRDRASMLRELANLPRHPESVPINLLVQVEGTPLYGSEPLDPFEFVRTVAATRLIMPRSYIRLSAGRGELGEAVQALCFLAGANSIFYGERLLTADNSACEADLSLFQRLGLQFEQHHELQAVKGCSRQPGADESSAAAHPAQ